MNTMSPSTRRNGLAVGPTRLPTRPGAAPHAAAPHPVPAIAHCRGITTPARVGLVPSLVDDSAHAGRVHGRPRPPVMLRAAKHPRAKRTAGRCRIPDRWSPTTLPAIAIGTRVVTRPDRGTAHDAGILRTNGATGTSPEVGA